MARFRPPAVSCDRGSGCALHLVAASHCHIYRHIESTSASTLSMRISCGMPIPGKPFAVARRTGPARRIPKPHSSHSSVAVLILLCTRRAWMRTVVQCRCLDQAISDAPRLYTRGLRGAIKTTWALTRLVALYLDHGWRARSVRGTARHAPHAVTTSTNHASYNTANTNRLQVTGDSCGVEDARRSVSPRTQCVHTYCRTTS